MAKWGEGDPRWIVEERPDATNVNNWHWTEKNAGPWSKERLKELLNNLKIAQNGIDCKITELEKLDGEASANNRKGKLIFFYEWDIKLKWEGRLSGGSEVTKGEVHIPNLSEENDVSEVDMTVTIKGSGAEEVKEYHAGESLMPPLKKYIRSPQRGVLQSVAIYYRKKRIICETGQCLYNHQRFQQKDSHGSCYCTQEGGWLHLILKALKSLRSFSAEGKSFYDALTRIEMVTAFTQGHVKMEAEKGGKFALFGGNITGSLGGLDDHTLVTVKQDLIPSAEVEQTRENWKRYYFESIKRAFGFGAFL
ncbi:hypothetical protein MSG28_009534 [Choristoneura fumiferana]|uniref:Uncharacterized protein n=1 Tax=Choristoneura fumiferana TaxID=7141 RepID=A0ACC0JBF7_CHOFU|nr:hypothetical protein MSG28_009534 [Choristoneura fumiferana]